MKKYYINLPLSIATIATMVMPLSVLAHGHNGFQIGDKNYQFIVGSLNEPILVDDKTGVDIRVNEEIGGDDVVKPVIGLEKDLKVELIAGDQKKVLELTPTYNDPGAYRATFIPTIETTYTYRVFGKINGIDVNLPFTCNPVGHVQTDEEMKPVVLSAGVTQTEKAGAFGCPMARANLGFPESAITGHEVVANDQMLAKSISSTNAQALGGIVLGLVSLVMSIILWVRKPKAAL